MTAETAAEAVRRNRPTCADEAGQEEKKMKGQHTMMHKLYKYTGSVESISYRRNAPDALPFAEIVLYDINDDDKAPVKVEASGGLADYIIDIEGTDAEERYLAVNWYYDSSLFLHGIAIPSSDESRPAKIIAQHDAMSPRVSTFGPADYIETSKPEPMTRDQYGAWLKFRSEDDYRN